MRILTVATLITWIHVTTAEVTTTEALTGDADDYKDHYRHRILRFDPRTVDYKDGNGGVVAERVHVNSSSNINKNNNKKMINKGFGNGKSSLQAQEQVSTMHPLDGRCQSTKLDETQKARLGCPLPPPPPQQQPTLRTVTISNAVQESDNDSNVKTKTDTDSSLVTSTNLRKKGQSFAATIHAEYSPVNHKVVNNDDDDAFRAPAADAEELAVKPTKLGGESAISRSRRCQSPNLSAAMKKRLKCPDSTTVAAVASSSKTTTTTSTLEANSSVKEIKIKSDDFESSASSLIETPERTLAPKKYMDALSFAVNGHGPEEHARDGATTIDDTAVASQSDSANDDDDAAVETAAPSPMQEEQQLLTVEQSTTKPNIVISATSSAVDNGMDAAAAAAAGSAAPVPKLTTIGGSSASDAAASDAAAAAAAAAAASSTTATTKSQNVRSNNKVPAESVIPTTTTTTTTTRTTTTNRRMSRRKFLSYMPSQWETIWMNGIQEWENNFNICEQFQHTSTDDADNNELLQPQQQQQQRRQQQVEFLSKYMNFLCQERFAVPHEEWCYLHDGRHHVYYNTESQKTTGTWEIYADQTPAVLQDVDLPISTTSKSFVSPQKGDEDIFSKFVFLDETTGEVYEEYIEPLVSHLRFPLAQCQENIQDQMRAEGLAWYSGYVMPPPSLSRFQRKFYIDVGGDRWQRLHYVARTWERQDGGAWDSIYSFANHVKDTTFYKKMPDSVRDKLERQDAIVTMEPTDMDGEQFLPDFIEKETQDDEYVLLKLDKGNPATKEGIVQYILDHVGEVHVDELIWQHNLEHNYLMKVLFDTVEPQPLSDQSLSEAYNIFSQLRQKGIRAHSWI